MSFFTDRLQNVTLSSIRTAVIASCQAAGLKLTNWRIVGVGMQMFEAFCSTTQSYSQSSAVITRGFASLDTATDPGDVDAYDPNNQNLPPDEGFLTNMGRNTFFTEREGQSFASGLATFVNAGPGSRTLVPFSIIYTWTGGSPPDPPPTYTNTDDPSIYVGGSVTVPAGSSITIPVRAQIAGSIASAPSSTLSLTSSLIGCTGTNPDAIVGSDREDAEAFRVKCRQMPARLSLGGPAAAYEYLATKNLDGTPLLNDSVPPVPVAITRVQVTQSSATGIVNAYYATGSGGAIADDVSAANNNIEMEAFAVGDAITFSGFPASTTSIHIVGTAKIRAKIGLDVQKVAEAIVASLVANVKLIPIGGLDQDSGGNGVVYTPDLQAFAQAGFLGLYDVKVTTPATETTAIPVGHVPVANSTAGDGLGSGDWTITVVS